MYNIRAYQILFQKFYVEYALSFLWNYVPFALVTKISNSMFQISVLHNLI